MPAKPKIRPDEDDERDDSFFDGKTSRFRFWIDKLKWRFEIAGPVLDKPGALLGIGMIVASVLGVLLLVGDKIGKVFKWW